MNGTAATTGFKGSKYNSALHGAALTAAIRADLKTSVKAGELPKLDYSVRLKSGSMYQAVHVTIGGYAGHIHNRDTYVLDARGQVDRVAGELLAAEAASILHQVRRIVRAYLRDDSDIQSDYFNVNFYDHVGFATESRNADWEALAADLATAVAS